MERTSSIFPEFRCIQSIIVEGEPFEFEWDIFPGHTTVEILREIHMRVTVRKTRSEEFEERIIFMSMFNGIDGTNNVNYKFFSNSEMVQV